MLFPAKKLLYSEESTQMRLSNFTIDVKIIFEPRSAPFLCIQSVLLDLSNVNQDMFMINPMKPLKMKNYLQI